MRIIILTYGSRGDVQPFPALSLRLEWGGWIVRQLMYSFGEAESIPSARDQAIGRKIRSEDGMGETVKWIEKYSNEFHSQHL